MGAIDFNGEGDKDWLSDQFDKILQKAPKLLALFPEPSPKIEQPQPAPHTPMAPDPSIAQQPLASFLKDKNATSNQPKKFLATAIWLEARGMDRLNFQAVTRALRIANRPVSQILPAHWRQMLRRVIAKGMGEISLLHKKGKGHFRPNSKL